MAGENRHISFVFEMNHELENKIPILFDLSTIIEVAQFIFPLRLTIYEFMCHTVWNVKDILHTNNVCPYIYLETTNKY